MRHQHADLIKEWAEDTSRVVQYESVIDGEWKDAGDYPHFNPDWNWRLKPEPKPDVVLYLGVDSAGRVDFCSDVQDPNDNLKLTLDGETGKLKSAEVIGD